MSEVVHAVSVEQCGSCGGTHADVAIQRYAKPHPPFTHWYICPDSLDPCQVIVSSIMGERVAVAGEVISMLEKAVQSGKYMVAVSWIDGDIVRTSRKSVHFPSGDYKTVVKHLKDGFDEELGLPQQMEMEQASPVPLVNLFGE